MDKAKSISTLMHLSQVLEADEDGDNVFDKLYRSIIGTLLYHIASRPDIQLSVRICARFQSNLKQPCFNTIKRILRHLVGITNLGLQYKKGTICAVTSYCDVDFARNKVAEAKYIFIANCYAQILWIKHQLEDFNLRYTKIPIMYDNISAINLTKNPIQHSRSKHMDIKHHFLRDHVQKGDIKLIFVNTEDQIADISTKPQLNIVYVILRTF